LIYFTKNNILNTLNINLYFDFNNKSRPKGTGYRLLSHQKPVQQLDLDAGQRLFLSFEASLFLSEWNWKPQDLRLTQSQSLESSWVLGPRIVFLVLGSLIFILFPDRMPSSLFLLYLLYGHVKLVSSRCGGRDSLWACCICFSRNRFKGFHKLEQRRL